MIFSSTDATFVLQQTTARASQHKLVGVTVDDHARAAAQHALNGINIMLQPWERVLHAVAPHQHVSTPAFHKHPHALDCAVGCHAPAHHTTSITQMLVRKGGRGHALVDDVRVGRLEDRDLLFAVG